MCIAKNVLSVSSLKTAIFDSSSAKMKTRFFLILLLLSHISYAQEKTAHTLGVGISMTRLDYFLGLRYQQQYDHAGISAGIGTGIGKTFFQQRLFPMINFATSWNFLDNPSVTLGPEISFSYSALRQNGKSSRPNFWQEYYVGYIFTVGKKIRFVQISEAGYMLESYFSTYNKAYKSVLNLGYSFHIGLSYAL